MDALTAAVHWVGDKVMGQLFDAMTKRVMGEVNPQFQRLQRDLQQVRDIHEDLLVAPLREAVRFRELGDEVKAKEKLIEAEVKNPLAPVPRLMLAEMFHAEQRYDVAKDYLAQATLLNPYCAAEYTGSSLLMAGAAGNRATPNDDTSCLWTVYLGDRDYVKGLVTRFKWPSTLVQQFLAIGFAPRSTAAIRCASVCADHIAVDWLLADSLHHKPEHVLSLMNATTGATEWAHLNTTEELRFATYRHVVVAHDNCYVLLDSATGQPAPGMGTMSRRYFESMFGMTADTPMFATANWLGTPPAIAYDKSAEYFGAHHGKPGDPGNHRAARYEELVDLRDPLRAASPAIRVRNRWEHFHFTPGPNMFPTCRLIGGARLERQG